MSTEFTDKDKEIMTKAMGEGMGQALKGVMDGVRKEADAKNRITEQRYENTVERLVRIETKLDELVKKLG